MIEVEALAALTQFGVAGLVAWMWLAERRAAAGREREISEAHGRLMSDRIEINAVIDTVRANTRAMTALEAAQRELIGLIRDSGRDRME